jgi:hypothetical protein
MYFISISPYEHVPAVAASAILGRSMAPKAAIAATVITAVLDIADIDLVAVLDVWVAPVSADLV